MKQAEEAANNLNQNHNRQQMKQEEESNHNRQLMKQAAEDSLQVMKQAEAAALMSPNQSNQNHNPQQMKQAEETSQLQPLQ